MKTLKRRDFIRAGMLAGSAALIGPRFASAIHYSPSVAADAGIVTVGGEDPSAVMEKLLEPLGGISRFVKPGQTVGILLNSPWKNPGYFTRPEVGLAVAKLCLDAGAGKIVCFKPVPSGYWEKSRNFDTYKAITENFTYGSEREEVEIPGGKSLKKAEMFKIFREVDVYISIPVAKHHNGVIFSGNLKGLMGVSSSNTNRHMHSPDGQYSYDNHEYLAQCIADLNLVRLPDLCIVDAWECALTNGPAGPGEICKPGKLIAGTDPLALDVYASKLMGFNPDDILTFAKASELGLGEIDPGKLKTVEL
jgi:uncharacterized protein (DUF362 family)